jgi:hypothetical protein
VKAPFIAFGLSAFDRIGPTFGFSNLPERCGSPYQGSYASDGGFRMGRLFRATKTIGPDQKTRPIFSKRINGFHDRHLVYSLTKDQKGQSDPFA